MDKSIIIPKLIALRNLLDSWLKNEHYLYFDPKETQDIFERFVLIQKELCTSDPLFFEDLPIREMPKSSGTTDNAGRGYIERSHLELLLKDINYCLDILTNQPVVNISSMTISREGVFFAGQFFDALQKVTGILEQSSVKIDIIDGYINSNVLTLFTKNKFGVLVNILTKKVDSALKTAAIAFNKQYGGLSIRTSNAFHDRFIVIDDKDFYHFGASIKDLGNKGFMFSLIEEQDIIDIIREKIIQEWNRATAEI